MSTRFSRRSRRHLDLRRHELERGAASTLNRGARTVWREDCCDVTHVQVTLAGGVHETSASIPGTCASPHQCPLRPDRPATPALARSGALLRSALCRLPTFHCVGDWRGSIRLPSHCATARGTLRQGASRPSRVRCAEQRDLVPAARATAIAVRRHPLGAEFPRGRLADARAGRAAGPARAPRQGVPRVRHASPELRLARPPDRGSSGWDQGDSGRWPAPRRLNRLVPTRRTADSDLESAVLRCRRSGATAAPPLWR